MTSILYFITFLWFFTVVVPSSAESFQGFVVGVGFLPLLMVLPLLSILSTVLYLHFRAEREGLNNEVLIRDIVGSAPTLDAAEPVQGQYRPVDALDDDDKGVPLVHAHNVV